MGTAEINRLLAELSAGDQAAKETLFSIIYADLHEMASRSMRGERSCHTLQTTALVNETYVRLLKHKNVRFNTKNHFFALAAQTMRRILVDHARRNIASKRGSGQRPVRLDECPIVSPEPSPELVALDDALQRLAAFDPRQARIVEMRFFAGMNEEEIGDVLGISSRTVKRDWALARTWLYGELRS